MLLEECRYPQSPQSPPGDLAYYRNREIRISRDRIGKGLLVLFVNISKTRSLGFVLVSTMIKSIEIQLAACLLRLYAAETIITPEDIAMAKLEQAGEQYGPHLGFYMFKSRDVHILIKLTATVSKKPCSTVPTGHGVSKM